MRLSPPPLRCLLTGHRSTGVAIRVASVYTSSCRQCRREIERGAGERWRASPLPRERREPSLSDLLGCVERPAADTQVLLGGGG